MFEVFSGIAILAFTVQATYTQNLYQLLMALVFSVHWIGMRIR